MPAHQPVPEDNWRHLLADFPPSRRRCVNSFFMLLVAASDILLFLHSKWLHVAVPVRPLYFFLKLFCTQ